MSIASTMSGFFSIDGPNNVIREAWDRLHRLPGGKRLFSKIVGRAAPYTGTIDARVLELRDGFSRVEMEDRPGLRNHLKSVHAIALVNLAEITGNVAISYCQPNDARFIVAGLSIDYVKKARGRIVGACGCRASASAFLRLGGLLGFGGFQLRSCLVSLCGLLLTV